MNPIKEKTQLISIGDLAEKTSVNIETIRYYERIGLLPKPDRSPGGRRLYTSVHVQRLCFIRNARNLGFKIDDVRTLASLDAGETSAVIAARQLTSTHLDEVRRKIASLKKLEAALKGLLAECKAGSQRGCAIVASLDGAS